jgi:hypothetical protein
MWMRVISSWCCYALYAWSLWVVSTLRFRRALTESRLAPVLLPDRFGDL